MKSFTKCIGIVTLLLFVLKCNAETARIYGSMHASGHYLGCSNFDYLVIEKATDSGFFSSTDVTHDFQQKCNGQRRCTVDPSYSCVDFEFHCSKSINLVNQKIHDVLHKHDKSKFCDGIGKKRNKRQNDHCPANSATIPVTLPGGRNHFNTIEQIAATLREDTVNTITTETNDPHISVTSYTTIEAPPNHNHPQSMRLTVTMQAIIRYNHLGRPARPAIPSAISHHLNNMDWYRDGTPLQNDEQGHLLADSLGGPTLPYNFVPQSPAVNRAVNLDGSLVPPYCWYDVESEIRDYLQIHGDGRYVRWTITIAYGGLPESRRPTGFMLSVRRFDANHRFLGEQEYVFPNPPTPACFDRTHPFWQI